MATATKALALDETLQDVVTKLQGIASAIAAFGGGGTKPNLLINGWFTINQRGVTSGTASYQVYGLDRWRWLYSSTAGTYSLTSSGLTLTPANSGEQLSIEQPLVDYALLDGETLTASVLFSNGAIKTGTATYAVGTSVNFFGSATSGDVVCQMNGSGLFRFRAYGTAVTIRAVKLEKGSTSTLHLDTVPDYTTELSKCRRYFRRIKEENNATLALFLGMIDNATTARFMIQNPVPMRTRPKLNYSGTLVISDGTNSYTASAVTIPNSSTGEFVRLDVTSSGMTAGSVCRLNITANSYIDFDAELT